MEERTLSALYYIANPDELPDSVDCELGKSAIQVGWVTFEYQAPCLMRDVRFIEVQLGEWEKEAQRKVLKKIIDKEVSLVVETIRSEDGSDYIRRNVIPKGTLSLIGGFGGFVLWLLLKSDKKMLYIKDLSKKKNESEMTSRVKELERKVAELEGDIDYLESK